METQPQIVIPEESLQSLDVSNQLSDITTSLTDTFAPFILLSLVITGLFVMMHIISMFRRRKLENALFDMQRVLHEMNERDKARQGPRPLDTAGNNNDRILAVTEPQKIT